MLHVVKASGEATIAAKPDQAEISLGVDTDAATAEAAAEQNAVAARRVIDKIKQVLGGAGKIETRRYVVTPLYKREFGQGHITGYRAVNTVLVKTGDLPMVPKILDGATAAGATQVGLVSFSLRNDAAVRAQVFAEAAQEARANAEAIASGLSLHVERVLEAESVQEAGGIRPGFIAAQSVEVNTPIQPSSIEVRATVTVTLQVQ